MKLENILVDGFSWKKGQKYQLLPYYQSDLQNHLAETDFFKGGRVAVKNIQNGITKIYLYPKIEDSKKQVEPSELYTLKRFNLN